MRSLPPQDPARTQTYPFGANEHPKEPASMAGLSAIAKLQVGPHLDHLQHLLAFYPNDAAGSDFPVVGPSPVSVLVNEQVASGLQGGMLRVLPKNAVVADTHVQQGLDIAVGWPVDLMLVVALQDGKAIVGQPRARHYTVAGQALG